MTRLSRPAIVVIVLAWLAVVGIILVAVVPPSDAPFREYVAELRAAGRPTSLAEYVGPAPDPSDNVADAVAAASQEEKSARAAGVAGPWVAADDDAKPWFETTSADHMRELGAYLDGIAPIFDRLDVASRRSHLYAPIDAGLLPSDPLVPELQSAHRLLMARAFAGTTDAARLRAIETSARLSRLCRGGVIQRMVGVAMLRGAVGALRVLCDRGSVEATALRARFDPVFDQSALASFPDLARAELASTVRMFQGALDGEKIDGQTVYDPSNNLLGRTVLGIYGNRGTTVGSPSDWVHACRWIDDVASLDATTYPALRRAVAVQVEALPQYSAARTSGIIFPKMVEMLGRTDAATRLARVALAAAEHRARHGDFPASLDELKPMFPDGVPRDPYTDAPFVYGKTAAGVRIASVGRLPEDPPVDDATLRERSLVWELKR